MALTGKDIFAAFKQHDVDAIKHVDASAYGVVADMLNAQFISPLFHALQALEEQYREKHAATRVLLSESYAEMNALLHMSEPSREEAQAREESLKELQQRIYAFLRNDEEPSPSQQVASFKALVKDYEAMLQRFDPIIDDFKQEHPYDKARLDLNERANRLLGEES